MRNHDKALRWAKQAHRCGILIGTSIMGTLMVPEEESRSEGLLTLGIAAGKGDAFANYQIGKIYAKGLFGCAKDLDSAIAHLEAAMEGDCKRKNKEKARKLLEQIRPVAVNVSPTQSPTTTGDEMSDLSS